MLKILHYLNEKAISTCASSGKLMRRAEVYGCFWKFLDVSQSCKMLQLAVQRCGSVSSVCRYI